MADSDPITSEIWNDIPGYSGYEASNHGRVRSWWKEINLGGSKGMILVASDTPHLVTVRESRRGYRTVMLRNNRDEPGKLRTLQIHRLVLMAFAGPCPEGHEGCHRDGSRTNNRLDNLYWGTRADNCQDTSRHGRNRKLKVTGEMVQEIRRLWHSGRIMQIDIAKQFDLNKITVFQVIHGFGRYGKL